MQNTAFGWLGGGGITRNENHACVLQKDLRRELSVFQRKERLECKEHIPYHYPPEGSYKTRKKPVNNDRL